MALKKKITQAEYDALAEGLRAAYAKEGDGWRLDLAADDPGTGDGTGDGDGDGTGGGDGDGTDNALQAVQKLAGVVTTLAAKVDTIGKAVKPPEGDGGDEDRITRLENELAERKQRDARAAWEAKVREVIQGRRNIPKGVETDVMHRFSLAGLALQENGNLEKVENGVVLATASSVLSELQKSAPHLFRDPTGTSEGAGTGSLPGASKTMTRPTEAEFLANLDGIASGETEVHGGIQ